MSNVNPAEEPTVFTITDDRISPTADTVTADEFVAYIRDMNETCGWGIDLDTIRVRDGEILVGGETVAVAA